MPLFIGTKCTNYKNYLTKNDTIILRKNVACNVSTYPSMNSLTYKKKLFKVATQLLKDFFENL